ncbi:hypothetical protein FE257_010862 [Aspergillus nanangensis]|uniref:Amine oxidase n=1 Tax=Aspergillus nanangensis TaxID=2582783 RepID=A0AAD4CVM3_ASPNN|nr:hypothetical protein FE257_010862 [Aspergillus nanangensis]
MYDIVVIGAGLSGLQAAYSAQQAGLSVAVVEARDRVGGKVWTVETASGRGKADLGAAWVNDKKQRRIWSYAQRFGLTVVAQRLVGRAVMQLNDNERFEFPFGITPDFTAEEKKNLERIRDHVQAETLKPGPPRPEDDAVTIDQYVRNLGALPKTIQMVNVWTKAMHGVESTQESAAYFIDYCRRNTGLLAVRADDQTGGNYLRFVQGAQSIAEGLTRLIDPSNIYLSNPVSSIKDHHSHISVTTTTGKTFQARKCILSVPSTMYKEFNITPTLPAPVQTLANETILGNYNKVIVAYDTPWWRDLGFNGFFMSYSNGPVTLGRDTSVDEKRLYALTLFVQGDKGYAWSQLPHPERRARVIKQLAAVYNVGKDAEVYRPIEYFEQIWKNEQFSRGALVPITKLGHLTEFAEVYGKPVGNLHFVGTEYAAEWKGYMEGALCSGEQGAREVVEAMSRGQRARL